VSYCHFLLQYFHEFKPFFSTRSKDSGPWVEEDRRQLIGGIRVVPVALYEDIPAIYKEYVQSYVNDLKEIYSLNLWPCSGVDYQSPKYRFKRVPKSVEDEIAMALELYRPWGGEMAMKWTKPGKTVEFEFAWCNPK
jgi:hypothetical protein